MSPIDQPKVYVLLLNYNGWQDTLECLESLYKLSYPNWQPVVVDNQSEDGSLDYIIRWANGQQLSQTSPENPLRAYSDPPVSKPIAYTLYQQADVEKSQCSDDANQLILIQAEQNLGFAAGNNIGLNYALARNDFAYVWLLNNDTVVDPDSLANLVGHAQQSGAGITGAILRYYHRPSVIQCVGGSYYQRWLGVSHQIGNGENDQGQYQQHPPNPDLIIGACMLVSGSFLKTVGLMNEEYFLYFEEQDWAERARRKGIRFGVAPNAIVYHKEGATIGSGQHKSSRMADYYYARNKILFTRRFFGLMNRLTVYGSLLLTMGNRIRRRQWDRIPLLLNAAVHPRKPFGTNKR